MAHSKKTNQSPLRKQGRNQNRDREGAAQSPKAPKKTNIAIQSPEIPPLPPTRSMEQSFRERQAATSAISKLIMEEMQTNDPRSLNRRSCWMVINELYYRLCCCKEETPIDEIQKINRILIEQGKLQILHRKSKSKTRESVTNRSGPLPDTLSNAIRELYGGSIPTNTPVEPQCSGPVDNHDLPLRSGSLVENPPDNS